VVNIFSFACYYSLSDHYKVFAKLRDPGYRINRVFPLWCIILNVHVYSNRCPGEGVTRHSNPSLARTAMMNNKITNDRVQVSQQGKVGSAL